MKEYFGSCHCNAVSFRFQSEESVEIRKCNCSICNPSDYEHLFIKHEAFSILQGEDTISSYAFGTKNADHTFCTMPGFKDFYKPRSHPNF